MTYQVFYMNPGATQAVCQLVRAQLPEGWELSTPHDATDFSSELAVADFIVVATEAIREEHLAVAPRLKMIQHQGVGFEKIDLEACERRGIPVGLTPEGTSIGVAEHTLLLLLSVYKRIVAACNGMQQGEWMQWSLRDRSFELSGKTVGLVGLGRIGREVAKRLIAFESRVIYFDALAGDDHGLAVERVASLQQLLASSDILSLHVPQTAETYHMINDSSLAQMKVGGVLINTARGGLVDEAALVRALDSGQLGGAGLDVFETEPLPADHPLLRFENVVATPHIAAGTRDALSTKMQAVFANLQRFVRNQPLRNLVTKGAIVVCQANKN